MERNSSSPNTISSQSIDVFLDQFDHLCHHGICNEGHVFVLPQYVKGTENVYESISVCKNKRYTNSLCKLPDVLGIAGVKEILLQ